MIIIYFFIYLNLYNLICNNNKCKKCDKNDNCLKCFNNDIMELKDGTCSYIKKDNCYIYSKTLGCMLCKSGMSIVNEDNKLNCKHVITPKSLINCQLTYDGEKCELCKTNYFLNSYNICEKVLIQIYGCWFYYDIKTCKYCKNLIYDTDKNKCLNKRIRKCDKLINNKCVECNSNRFIIDENYLECSEFILKTNIFSLNFLIIFILIK